MKTEVWEIRPCGRRILRNTIEAGSKFHSFDVPKRISDTQHTAESQMWIANEIMNGWRINGPYAGIYKYEAIHV